MFNKCYLPLRAVEIGMEIKVGFLYGDVGGLCAVFTCF